MRKTILLTGATDGIGLETAAALVARGHRVLLHGRNPRKLDAATSRLRGLPGGGACESYRADLSRMAEVEALAAEVATRHEHLDVLMNNAGIFNTAQAITADGLDVRFAVNTLAPYLLTRRLMPLLDTDSRVVNLSSAAQAPVDLETLAGRRPPRDAFDAYAQSKLAITMWTSHMGRTLGDQGPVTVAVNPGSLLATKMVKEGFGTPGKDPGIGVDILLRAALSDEFAQASGTYFDNDAGRFAPAHPDASDTRKVAALIQAIDEIVERIGA